jgi:hypothetical protein
MRSDGTGRKRLTSSLSSETNPRWSPSGDWIAYVDGDGSLRVIRPDGTGGKRVSALGSFVDGLPEWSPDGRSLAYIAGDPPSTQSFLFVARIEGGVPRRVAPALVFREQAVSWSPDGRLIAFVNLEGLVSIVRPDGTGTRPVTTREENEGFQLSPVWSPDGTEIAHTRWIGQDKTVWVQSLSGGPAREVAAPGPPASSVAFEPPPQASDVATGALTEANLGAADAIEGLLRGKHTPTAHADVAIPAAASAAVQRLPTAMRGALAVVFDAFASYRRVAAASGAQSSWTSEDLLDAKVRLVGAATALRDAVAESSGALKCSQTVIPLVVVLAVGSCDNEHTTNVALSIDMGGNDRYTNNAGGGRSWLNAAALIDLSGNDRYTPYGSGVNGGGSLGSGFLTDLGGNDLYVAYGQGVNGGGAAGAGFLVDAAGNDRYLSRSADEFGSPGANGGGAVGSGFLLDTCGNDRYAATSGAVNGGSFGALFAWALTAPASGFLMDGSGNDRYASWDFSTNGGAYFADALLLDKGGDDVYRADEQPGGLLNNTTVNGGAFAGSGKLLDLSGRDRYSDGASYASDRTVTPKGAAGAQIDAPTPRV